MAQPERRSTDVGRMASTRNSTRFSMNIDEDENEYGLEAMGVADGFRPTSALADHNRMSSRAGQHENPTIARRSTPPPRPSSTTKPNYSPDSFALRHDGPSIVTPSRPPLAASSSSASTVTRSSSISTDTPYMVAEGPYQGPSGPSHPYQMYSQTTRPARTLSVATTSTFAVPTDRRYTGPNGPAHPYQLYPQSAVNETDNGEDGLAISSIPVGFPGLGVEYQRRLGPDGEEAADIIGPDGHTEQLPPYTQYPDEAFARKLRSTGPNSAGAGGIGLATRNPEFESRDDLRSPQSRQSSRSLTSDLSDHQINTAAVAASEKPSEPTWKQIARKKVWGIIPVWVFVLFSIIAVLLVVLLGSILGVLANKHNNSNPPKPQQNQNQNSDSSHGSGVYITVTTTYDATVLSSMPTALPTLPTGTFILPISTPEVSQQTCLLNAAQSKAWTCALPMSLLQMTITSIPDNDHDNLTNNQISMSVSSNSLSAFFYGSQPPTIDQNRSLTLVRDSDASRYGPAWFVQLQYDKLVILPDTFLSATGTTKRDSNAPPAMQRKVKAQAGEQPWFCYWNGTLLEAFIYSNATSAAGAQQSSASATASTSPSTPLPSSTSSRSGYYSTTPSSTTSSQSATTSDPQAAFLASLPSQYPRIVKVEEHRMPNSEQAYCVQMSISQDGMRATELVNSSGGQNKIFLNETEPSYFTSKLKRGEDLWERQNENACSCLWRAV